MNYGSFLFKITEAERAECIQAMEMAKAIDKESVCPNLSKSYELYQKASTAHLPFAERRLGSMTINGEGTSADFYKGVAYYLMAAEDGDLYSEDMLHFIWTEENNPIQFLYGAKNNNFNDMLMLLAFYMKTKFFERATEWCAKGALLGNDYFAINLAEVLFRQDEWLYEQDSDNYKLYYQSKDWIDTAMVYLTNNQQIYQEVLVVNSRVRMAEVFSILLSVLKNNLNNEAIRKRIFEQFVDIVNDTNSFKRNKPLR